MLWLVTTALAATISGVLDGPLGDEVRVEDAHGAVLATAPIRDLAFELEVPIDRFRVVWLKSGQKSVRQLYLAPEDTLELSLRLDPDGQFVQQVDFAGAGAERQRAVAEFDGRFRRNGGIDDRYYDAVVLSQARFLAAERRARRQQHRWVARADDLGEDAARWLDEWIELASLERTVFYVMHHEMYREEQVAAEGPVRDVLATLPPDRPESVDHPAYAGLLRSVAYRWHLDAEASGPARYREVWDRIDAALDGDPRELMRHGYLDQVLRQADSDEELRVLAELAAQVGGPPARVERLQTELKRRTGLGPGRPAPDFTLPDRDGNLVSLSSLRGQVVVLDFWGTWCGPCIEALPAMEALQAELADEPVAFVFVALEVGRRVPWLRFLEQRGLDSGTHLYAEGQFRCPELEPWALSSAPTYAVIDAEGRIVSANAPGPGGGLLDVVREAL